MIFASVEPQPEQASGTALPLRRLRSCEQQLGPRDPRLGLLDLLGRIDREHTSARGTTLPCTVWGSLGIRHLGISYLSG